ncbi:tetratricopeptide repeat-containing sensor histidine kinase [Aquimarina mytili]|uniref:Oxygen sensor histidine kinase NreB n=1 Tax=Aquimarina mytili TaxID=874423 RepID=A0A937DCF8_9FLAO|nr:sensor histidine kinase [Aquimarina mytili]MBL0684896.1 sensor histidine kinase [Aquimarina mytili]
MKKIKCHFLIPVSILLTSIMFSQKKELDNADFFLKTRKIDSATISIKKIDTNTLNTYNKGRFHFIQGKILRSKDIHHKAFEEFLTAKRNLELSDSISLIAQINLHIVDLLNDQKNLKVSNKPFLDEYIAYSKKTENSIDVSKAYGKIAASFLNADDSDKAIIYFDKAILEANKAKDTLLSASFLFNKGVVYNTVAKKYDSALYFFKKVLPVFKKHKRIEYLAYNYNNQAEAYKKLNNFNRAIFFYMKADSLKLRTYSLKTKKIFYQNISDLYSKSGNFENAFIYAKKQIQIIDSIDNQSQNNAIVEAENKYRAAQKEKLNLILQTEIEKKKQEQQLLWIGSFSLLILGSSIGFLIYKNTKRKQHIAEQQREIEIQKTEKLLKEQELASIDAMIAGQEKERQRLANDLHDNLGSTLATVKLHFQHLKNNKDNPNIENTTELYTKTDNLLEEAYQKVRTIAHEKNSGVMANQGLLPAIKKLAKKVSNSNQLVVEVQDYGLDKRLDNALEISIFRITQELITNAIKHAHASEIHISLTNHEGLLNIIIEDNGNGFDAKVLPKKDGMGLATIEKRIEHLEGTFEIDSTIGKGTHIIINIPI